MKTLCKKASFATRVIPNFLIVLTVSVFNTVIGQIAYQTVGPVKIKIEGTRNKLMI